ncbi:MAG: amidohydrolase family protein [Planctomycetes bacterium]|nr:amidohydrolase family protein [Planctomycetota bacterium]
MIIDIHCHYTLTQRPAQVSERFSFEPAETDGRPAYDSCIAPRNAHRLSWRAFGWYLGFKQSPALDQQIEAFYERHLHAGGPVDRIVLLAFDAYHDDAGRQVSFPTERGDVGSDIYTSNSLVRELCRRHPERFLFGASVHPYREGAVRCVEEVFAAGACLLKWIPLHQNIDIADPRTLAVMRRCAELGLPLLLHYSEEFTLSTNHREYRSATALLDVLRRLRRAGCMPPTILAHVATPVSPFGERDSHNAVVSALLDEFADAPLYADISALTAWSKTGFLRRMARRQELHGKLLFGTDFPIPLALPRLRRDLGVDYRRIAGEHSWIQQAALIYRHLGFNEIVFHRAAELLPHVEYFAPAPATW